MPAWDVWSAEWRELTDKQKEKVTEIIKPIEPCAWKKGWQRRQTSGALKCVKTEAVKSSWLGYVSYEVEEEGNTFEIDFEEIKRVKLGEEGICDSRFSVALHQSELSRKQDTKNEVNTHTFAQDVVPSLLLTSASRNAVGRVSVAVLSLKTEMRWTDVCKCSACRS